MLGKDKKMRFVEVRWLAQNYMAGKAQDLNLNFWLEVRSWVWSKYSCLWPTKMLVRPVSSIFISLQP